MKNIQYRIIIFSLFLILMQSCKKIIGVDLPRNQLVTSSVFLDSSDANAAVVGIYSTIMQYSNSINFGNGAITIFSGLAGDEISTTSTDPDFQQFYLNQVSVQNFRNFGMWKFAYQIIYHANACLDGLESSQTLSDNLKSRLIGEAKFIRAWFYFNLVNIYGSVPLVSTIDYEKNSILARSSEQEIYTQIIKDLQDAENLLLEEYISPGKLRPNRFTASALLSRVYLYQGAWEKAEVTASKVINCGLYHLESDLNEVFLNESIESIWQLPPLQTSFGVPETRQFIPTSSALPAFPVTNELLNSFSIDDQRRNKWINSKVVNGITYSYPFKYKLRTSTNGAEHYMMFRLGEVLLNRAEARFNIGDIAGGLEDMNSIRLRAGLQQEIFGTQEYLLSKVYNERRLELFCEWGHRWYDLKRLGMVDSVLSISKPNWQSTDQLFPVPQSEIESNSALVQNPGY